MTVELWQAYQENGEPVSEKGYTKDEIVSGVLHGAVHVWLWRRAKGGLEILLQRRSQKVLTWPGFLDVSAAGHIDFGETPIIAAIRETSEELNVKNLWENRLDFVFLYRMRDMHVPETTFIENEIQWVYLLEVDSDINPVVDGREVESLLWVRADDEFRQIIQGEDAHRRMVPHGDEYFNLLLSSFQNV